MNIDHLINNIIYLFIYQIANYTFIKTMSCLAIHSEISPKPDLDLFDHDRSSRSLLINPIHLR